MSYIRVNDNKFTDKEKLVGFSGPPQRYQVLIPGIYSFFSFYLVDMVKDLYMGRLIILLGPKCNHTHPNESKTEGDWVHIEEKACGPKFRNIHSHQRPGLEHLEGVQPCQHHDSSPMIAILDF